MSEHALHHFSVTIQTDDLAVVGCLRSLSQFSQRTGNNRIPWGGTKDSDWQRAGNKVTFRFTCPEYREQFLNEAERLLPSDLWSVVQESDEDPARRQSR